MPWGSCVPRVCTMFKLMWAKTQLAALPRLEKLDRFYSNKLRYPECAEGQHANHSPLFPYDGLAEFWHDYASPYQPNYPAFLKALANVKNFELNSLLDLACGDGSLTTRLARIASEVVGLDASEPMLAQARARSGDVTGVRYVLGDFREFQLSQLFDAVVCAFNSVNYVGDISELRALFRSVTEHLRPGGRFVFDTTTDAGMKLLSGRYLHVRAGAKRFAIRFEYDEELRKEKSMILLPSGTEIHCRIPIDPSDAEEACHGTGLAIEDFFSAPLLPGRWYIGPTCFFVMRRV
jgi:SAM-dependent methyltransferase